MRLTVALRKAALSSKKKSLALSVHFKNPDFGMQDYEILSRASAFLLGIDPPDSSDIKIDKSHPFAHLEAAERKRELREFQRNHHNTSPASDGGKKGKQRRMMDMGWLEFVPREVRPNVHIVCSSHVLSPFLWRDYYPQEWLSHVRQEHCAYSVEVFDPEQPEKGSLAKLALTPEPLHHPEGRDIALIHFQEEKSSLQILKGLGVDILHFRDPEKLFEKGEEMLFDGFAVAEENAADNAEFERQQKQNDDDTRIFYAYREVGTLNMHTQDRFFASTPDPLPEGLCGAPVLDKDGDLCGTVEGIVPVTHENERLAGNAAFMPTYIMQAFIDYTERQLVEQIMPKDLFQMVVSAKTHNAISAGPFQKDPETGEYTKGMGWSEAYDLAMEKLRERTSPQEFKALMEMLEREHEQVVEEFNEKGGDMDEIIKRVRSKTMEQIREVVQHQYRKQQQEEDDKKEAS